MRQIIIFFIFAISVFADTLTSAQPGEGKYICPDINDSANMLFPCGKPASAYKTDNINSTVNNGENIVSRLESGGTGGYVCSYFSQNSDTPVLQCFFTPEYIKNSLAKTADMLKYINLSSNAGIDKITNIINSINKTYIPGITILSDGDISKIEEDYKYLVEIDKKGSKLNTAAYTSILNEVKNKLWTPIVSNNIDSRNYTFANFLGEIITLDPSVIKGVYSYNYQIALNPVWAKKFLTVTYAKSDETENFLEKSWSGFKHLLTWMFSSKPDSVSKVQTVPLTSSDFHLTSFQDFFKAPIWGYYYFLMHNFDYIINKLAVMLLILTGGYIGVMGSVKNYIRSKFNPQSISQSGAPNMKVKAVGMMGLITFFLLSPTQKDINGKIAFYTNNTIAKTVMRKAVDTGTLLGNITNDAGLYAYLKYFAYKENIIDTTDIQSILNSSLISLLNVKYETALMHDCMIKYKKKNIQDFLVNFDGKKVPYEQYPKQTATYTDADRISYDLCRHTAINIISVPKLEMQKIRNINDILDKMVSSGGDSGKVKAVKMAISSMMFLNEKFGWISVAVAPTTDVIMKSANLFLNNVNSNADIGKKVVNYIKKNKAKDETVDTDSISNSIKEFVTHKIGIVAIYMMMPGFNDIFKQTKGLATAALHAGGAITGLIIGQIAPIPGGSFIGLLVGSFVGKVLNTVFKPFISFIAFIIGFYMAMILWKFSIEVIFTVIISLIILFKIVFYFKDLLLYFVTSIFIPLAGYSRDADSRIKKFLIEGVFLTLYPAVFTALVYVFIFAYQFFDFLFDTIFKSFAYTQMDVVKNISATGTSLLGDLQSFTFAESIITAGDVLKYFVGILLAYFFLFKGVSWVMGKLGIESAAKNEQMSEQIIERGIKNVNPVV